MLKLSVAVIVLTSGLFLAAPLIPEDRAPSKTADPVREPDSSELATEDGANEPPPGEDTEPSDTTFRHIAGGRGRFLPIEDAIRQSRSWKTGSCILAGEPSRSSEDQTRSRSGRSIQATLHASASSRSRQTTQPY